VDQRLDGILSSIENFAERFGRYLNSKIGKVLVGSCFVILLFVFGFLTFFSKFTKSLLGIKESN
jgi:hypothetical protein